MIPMNKRGFELTMQNIVILIITAVVLIFLLFIIKDKIGLILG